jgi:hypothetical protein
MARPQIEPVTAENLAEFAEFLHRQLNADISPEQWQAGLQPGWAQQQPNHGFMLRDNGAVVGGIGAFYADRWIDGRPEKFCNITSWCVLESHRQHSMRLGMAVVEQPGYHFTDFSPTKVVAGTLKFFKFQPLDERQVVALNLPWPLPGRMRVLHRSAEIESALQGEALRIYTDHKRFPWLQHALVGQEGAWCHVIFKRRVLKRLPSAGVLYVSDPGVLQRGWRALSSHLLGRGFVSTQIEHRWLTAIPWPAASRTGFIAKVYLSPTLRADQIDYLYSETMGLDL